MKNTTTKAPQSALFFPPETIHFKRKKTKNINPITIINQYNTNTLG